MDAPLDQAGWRERLSKLPEAAQERLRLWFATQALIIEEVGIEEDEWFGLIAWAFDHPGDDQHLARLDGQGGELDADATELGRPDQKKAAALEVVGAASSSHVVATGDGLAKKIGTASPLQQELYQRFMNQRMNETGRRPKAPKRM